LDGYCATGCAWQTCRVALPAIDVDVNDGRLLADPVRVAYGTARKYAAGSWNEV
jgi:hypothetical protein